MIRILAILSALALAACSQPADDSEATAPEAAAPAASPSIYAAALANENRPAADRDRDANRKPAEVLEFLGITPGMTVLDMFSGGGYYTEILAHTVGDGGRVIAHSNEAYIRFVGEEFEQRYLGGRLPNAEVLMAENNELALEPDSLDAIMLVLSFHDLYFADPENGWPAFDVDKFLAELKSGLKADGVIGIIDHYATEGAAIESASTVHRIDPAIVIDAMTAAGFRLDAQSDLLRNPEDDHEKLVFDAEVRGKTDRFVMRFVKAD